MLEELIKRDRMIVLLGLLAVVALSWSYILSGAGMTMAPVMRMPDGADMENANIGWSAGYAVLMFAMWWIMMMAMMLPAAAPMILLFAAANRNTASQSSPAVPTFVFVAGYLLTWGFFSLFATGAQWLLSTRDLLDPMMRMTSTMLSGALLIIAGIYQFTSIKNACLRHCRSPMAFVMGYWIPGRYGALKMGMQHGVFCLGCCWFLMGLLFFGGVMSIAWIGGLAVYVLIEKLAPHGHLLGKIGGAVLIAWGAVLIWGTAAAL